VPGTGRADCLAGVDRRGQGGPGRALRVTSTWALGRWPLRGATSVPPSRKLPSPPPRGAKASTTGWSWRAWGAPRCTSAGRPASTATGAGSTRSRRGPAARITSVHPRRFPWASRSSTAGSRPHSREPRCRRVTMKLPGVTRGPFPGVRFTETPLVAPDRGCPLRRLCARWLGARWLGARWLGARWLGARWLGARWLGAPGVEGPPRCIAASTAVVGRRAPGQPSRPARTPTRTTAAPVVRRGPRGPRCGRARTGKGAGARAMAEHRHAR